MKKNYLNWVERVRNFVFVLALPEARVFLRKIDLKLRWKLFSNN